MIQNRFIQNALTKLANYIGVRSVAFEVTQRCNQDCAFCYNVWKCSDYPTSQLDTPRTKELLDRIISGYHPQVITFTGGEPLLRPDLIDLISHVSKRTQCNLISNGTLMTDDMAADLIKAGVKTFEFTLLSAEREVHNRLVGRESFDEMIEGIASVKAAGGLVVTTFVAMKPNIGGWEETLELNAALGVNSILFNRFNVGGEGIRHAKELMPSKKELIAALEIADTSLEKYGMSIACGVPFPPCVIDRTRFKTVHFSDCPVGTRRAYPTVDPLGNVRPCNHSPAILGNLFEKSFREILSSEAALSYASGLPEECRGCKDARTCRGGCRGAAEACGDRCGIDPFVKLCDGRDGV